MAELTIRPEEIRDALGKFVESYSPESSEKTEVGKVVRGVCVGGARSAEWAPDAAHRTMPRDRLRHQGVPHIVDLS